MPKSLEYFVKKRKASSFPAINRKGKVWMLFSFDKLSRNELWESFLYELDLIRGLQKSIDKISNPRESNSFFVRDLIDKN
jgi:hypothetical protein